MRTLAVSTSTLELAQGLHDALIGFQPALTRDGDGWRVTVLLSGDERRLLDILDALQRHLTARNDGSARIELEGRTYTLHPEEDG